MQAAATLDLTEGGDASLSDELFDKLLGQPEEQREPGYTAPHTKLQVGSENVRARHLASLWPPTPYSPTKLPEIPVAAAGCSVFATLRSIQLRS